MPLTLDADSIPWKITATHAYDQMRHTDISVVISLYNYEHFILSCIESALAAVTFDPSLSVEVLIINDASSDNSLNVVKRVLEANQDIALLLVDRTRNSGLSSTRNLGIRLSRGQSIFILDADNAIEPNLLTLLYVRLKATGASSVYCKISKYDSESNEHIGFVSDQEFSLNKLLRSNYIDAMALFAKSALFDIGMYDTRMTNGWEDYDVWISFALGGHRVEFVPEVLAYYRVHPGSMLSKLNDNALSVSRFLYQKHRSSLPVLTPECILFGHPSHLVTD